MSPEAIKDFLRQFELALATHSFDAVRPLIHPEAVFRFNEGDFAGLDAIRGVFEATWGHAVEGDSYIMTDINVIAAEGPLGVATFAWEWSGSRDDGPFEIDGRGTSVVVQHDGMLKVLLEHLSR